MSLTGGSTLGSVIPQQPATCSEGQMRTSSISNKVKEDVQIEDRGPPIAESTVQNTSLSPTSATAPSVRQEPQVQDGDDVPSEYYPNATEEELDDLHLLEAHQREIEAEERKRRDRLVAGINNDDLYALLRTFERQIHNVHVAPPPADPSNLPDLDLWPSPEEEFTADKVMTSLERLYAGPVLGMSRAVQEIQRIRKWKEGGRRSAVALLVYAAAWWYNVICTTLVLFATALVVFPAFRRYAFDPPRQTLHLPPTPANHDRPVTTTIPAPSPIDPNNPSSSENQAVQWAETVQSVLTSLFSPTSTSGDETVTRTVKEVVNGVIVNDMQRKRERQEDDVEEKKTDLAIRLYGQPAMRIIGGLADKWERAANALSPTPPFSFNRNHTRLLCVISAALLVLFNLVSEKSFSRIAGILFGVIMFGQPVLSLAVRELDARIPDWKEKIILENNILSDVPTNAQLVLRLLRDAEHRRRPLPPPSAIKQDTSQQDTSPSDTEKGKEEEVLGNSTDKSKPLKTILHIKEKMSTGLRSRARRAWDRAGKRKEEAFAAVTGHNGVDYAGKAKSGMQKLHISQDTKPANALLDKLPVGVNEDSPDSPTRFYVHHWKHGPGHLIIHPPTIPSDTDQHFTSARIEFTTIRHVPPSGSVSLDPNSQARPSRGHLVISINDIISIKKEGMNWPGRLLTSWALDAEGAGGTGLELKIIRRNPLMNETGGLGGTEEVISGGEVEVVKLKGIVRRDELFGKLLAIGEQRWEMM